MENNKSEFLIETDLPKDEVMYQKIYDDIKNDSGELKRVVTYS